MGLQDLDDAYDKTEAAERKSTQVPDGRYQVKIYTLELIETSNGNPMLKFDAIILTGEHAGRHLFWARAITAGTLPYFKADLAVMGWPHKLSDLESHEKLASMLDLQLEVRQVTKGVNPKGYPDVNVYISKRIGNAPGSAPTSPASNSPAATNPTPGPARSTTVKQPVRSGVSDEPPF